MKGRRLLMPLKLLNSKGGKATPSCPQGTFTQGLRIISGEQPKLNQEVVAHPARLERATCGFEEITSEFHNFLKMTKLLKQLNLPIPCFCRFLLILGRF